MAVTRKTKTVARATRTVSKTKPTTKSTKATPTRTRAAATRTAAKPTPTRATRQKATPTPTKTTRASSRVKEVAKPTTRAKATAAKKNVGAGTGNGRTKDEITGFVVGTDLHTIAVEMMKGGQDRQEIIDRCRDMLPSTSRNGTPKAVANMVASVLGKMKDQGFTVSSSWVLEAPTKASKAAATRMRNKKLAAQG